MDPGWVGIVSLGVLLLLLALGVHVGLVLMIVSFTGLYVMTGSLKIALGILTTTPYAAVAVFSLTVVPLFVLMGLFAMHSGMGEALYTAAHRWVGRVPGGLGIASMLANAAFGTVTGSSVAAASIFAKLAVPEMKRYGYDIGFACGITAAAGIIAMLIPPSLYAIMAGVITEQSIGALLIAGVGPGLLYTLLNSLAIVLMAKFSPRLSPRVTETITRKQRLESLIEIWPVVLLAVGMVGGIFIGVFTPTEGAAAGALGAFAIALLRGKLTWPVLKGSLLETVRIVAMINLVVVGATMYSRFLALSGITNGFIAAVTGSELSPMTVLFAFIIVELILGCFLDGVSIMFLTFPVMFPIGVALGFHPIWFLTIMMFSIELGLLTPPLGLNVYVVKAAVGDQVTVEQVFRGVTVFLITGLIALLLLIVFPSLITYLPGMMIK